MSYEIVFYALSVCGNIFSVTGLYQSTFFTYSFGKLVLRLYVIFMFSSWSMSNSKKIFIIFINFITLEAASQACSVKKGVLRNFAKFTEKHLCQRLIFNKVAVGVTLYNHCFYQ